MKKTNKKLNSVFESYISAILLASYNVNKKKNFYDYDGWKILVNESLQLKGFYMFVVRKTLKSVIESLYQVCYDLRVLAISLPYDLWCIKVNYHLKERGLK